MIKYAFSCLFLLIFCAGVFAQQKKQSVVNLISSERSQGIKRNGADVIKVYRGVFQQEFSILRSDSAYFYPQINSFDAFGHVHITQGDTLNIYSDKLNYNGNTHIALLTDNVRMVDKDATLTTNFLTYNTATRIGTYTGGGKLVNKQNTLTSTNGYYFAYTRDSYFRYNVVLTTIDAIIKNDTLRYNTGSRIAYFYGPTHIYGKKNKDTLYTENGTYNTVTEQAFFGKKNLYTQGTKSLKGDSLFYDRLKGYGRAIKNVVFNDKEDKMTLNGDLGTYYQEGERTVVTRSPWVTIITEEKDSTVTDSAKKAVMPVKIKKAAKVKPAADIKTAGKPANGKADGDSLKVALVTDTARIKRDTAYLTADTLTTQVMTYKKLKEYVERQRLSRLVDTSAAAKAKRLALNAKPSKFLSITPPRLMPDTGYRHTNFFGPPKKPVVVQAKTDNAVKKLVPKLKPAVATKIDSINLRRTFDVNDTTRVRILYGHHNAKIFKSDLQGVADSIFFSTADSTIKFFINPMLWSQGSQMSGDTLYLQLKNKKLDNMDLFPKAFIANIENGDSTHFNQVAGKKMKGFFTDNKLSTMYVAGNAERIYFMRDSGKISGMYRSISGRIRSNFKNNKMENMGAFVKVEERIGPLSKFKEDDRILQSFIWKPKDRPESKEQIIPALDRQHKYARKPVVKPAPAKAKPPAKGAPVKMGKDSLLNRLKSLPLPNTDSLLKKVPVKLPADTAALKRKLKDK